MFDTAQDAVAQRLWRMARSCHSVANACHKVANSCHTMAKLCQTFRQPFADHPEALVAWFFKPRRWCGFSIRR